MDWKRAIEINQAHLTRIIAGLIAMVGLGPLGRIEKPLYWSVMRVLRPAESAVRRLIFLAARGLDVEPALVRPIPKGLVRTGKGSGRMSFQLFDPRKRFNRVRRKYAKVGPRVLLYFDNSPLVPLFRPRLVEPPAPVPKPVDATIDARRLGLRLAAIKLALDDLPRQTKRLVRWKARREKIKTPTFTSPLRPGRPPGYRQDSEEHIHLLLRECHSLAWDAIREDSS